MGFIVVLFGDCLSDARPQGPARCFAEQQVMVRTMMGVVVIGSLVFGVWAYGRLRRYGKLFSATNRGT